MEEVVEETLEQKKARMFAESRKLVDARQNLQKILDEEEKRKKREKLEKDQLDRFEKAREPSVEIAIKEQGIFNLEDMLRILVPAINTMPEYSSSRYSDEFFVMNELRRYLSRRDDIEALEHDNYRERIPWRGIGIWRNRSRSKAAEKGELNVDINQEIDWAIGMYLRLVGHVTREDIIRELGETSENAKMYGDTKLKNLVKRVLFLREYRGELTSRSKPPYLVYYDAKTHPAPTSIKFGFG